MATILFDGQAFQIGPDVRAGQVLGAACMRYGDAGDVFRFKLFDENGHELAASELVGKRRLSLCDVRKLRDFRPLVRHEEHRLGAGGK
ncbi:MAG TPA: hypothetical protein VN867_11915 [Candidatus Binataceae bacterium]|jgi:hypothetical protein|nr:hypothetical protein [Candidatus Binataceae bacterium]